MRELLKGAYDMHVHAGPDVIDRKMDDLELAAAYKAAGMKGFVIKSHYFDTAGRAYLVRRLFPDLNVVGTLVLNRSVGGLNPAAVEKAAEYGVRLVFMPTMDAWNMLHTESSIRVLRDGQLADGIEEILDIIRDKDMILCSGHIAPEETLALFTRAQEKGLRRLIATHVEWPPVRASLDMQKRYVECGAFLEHCVINILAGSLSVEELASQIREIGAAHMILSTDLGQASNPEPAAAFAEYAGLLLDAGVSENELRTMIAANPEQLITTSPCRAAF